MSKLNFASVSEAYSIGSEQIKNTQSEIARLKKIIDESSINSSSKKEYGPNEYTRIGNPDNVQAQFCKPTIQDAKISLISPVSPVSPNNSNNPNNAILTDVISPEEFDYTFLKIMRHPKFDEIVKNYVIIKHPEWLLNNTHYIPSGNFNTNTNTNNNTNTNTNNNNSPTTPMMAITPGYVYLPQGNTNQYILSRETFGASESLTKNYVLFFIVAMLIYLGMTLACKKS